MEGGVEPLHKRLGRRGGGRRGGRGGRGRGGPSSAVASPSGSDAQVPSEEAIDGTTTLAGLRLHEHAIMAATRSHEDLLAKLQTLYKRVRAKMYRDHKLAVIAEDNAKLQRFQGGCPKPKEVKGATKAQLDEQARCMQREAAEVDDSDLGLLMRRHLQAPVAPLPAGLTCASFRQIDSSQLSQRVRACLEHVGDARWTAEGLADAAALSGVANESAIRGAIAAATATTTTASCGRHWIGSSEARCLLANKNLIFFGNSVVRRQMYTLLDLLAGPAAHRQLTNFTDVDLRTFHDAGTM